MSKGMKAAGILCAAVLARFVFEDHNNKEEAVKKTEEAQKTEAVRKTEEAQKTEAVRKTKEAQKTEVTGIIGAMDEEVDSLKMEIKDARISTIAGMEFCEGKLDGENVVVVKCGIGKVNAGTCAQLLINAFGAKRIINTGVAGSLDASIDIGDIVVSIDAVQYDFDLTPLGYAPGELDGVGTPSLAADEAMRARAVDAVKCCAPEVRVFEGRICTGDQFVSSLEQKKEIVEGFGGLCCEMEGGAIAQICCQNKVPFVIIRAISDKADGSAEVSFTEFLKTAASRCAAITRCMVSH